MTDRQEQVSHDRWSKPEEVGTHMNRLLLRSWDLKEELDRVNREIKQWSHQLKTLLRIREMRRPQGRP